MSARRAVIMRNFLAAREKGENVEFIDGETLYVSDLWDACTVDGCHPNDLGFWRMSHTLEPLLRSFL